ncbi:hypothetical protein [Actinophytocola sp.]|uniref:hypothetical protein n=1 Tax=Actinophytocola sp. TaxID=1872138 RepID=UPI002D7E4BA3|nr:hypothetical protein [Actinophytocola sp.]HET9138005.1 hypothetical protein [Actinophytocola sp.]
MYSSIFGHLQSSLHHYLDGVIERSQHAEGDNARALARLELPRIVEALRSALAEHEPDERGRCRRCRTRLLRRAPAPCRAYLTAHLCLLVTEDDPRPPDLLDVAADLRNQLGAPG